MNAPKYDARAAGARCDECPLYDEDVVPPEGPPDAKLVIVGEAPGTWEIRKRKPFVGPSGVMLDDLLRDAGLRRKDCFVTNATLCRPKTPGIEGVKRHDYQRYLTWLRAENKRRKKAGEPLLVSPIECCAPRLGRELQWFEKIARERGQPNGAVVVPLGNIALRAVTGRDGVMKFRGAPLLLDLGGHHE